MYIAIWMTGHDLHKELPKETHYSHSHSRFKKCNKWMCIFLFTQTLKTRKRMFLKSSLQDASLTHKCTCGQSK